MKIKVIVVGKTLKGFIGEGVDEYLKRLKRYLRVEVLVIPDVKVGKSLPVEQLMKKEEELILSGIANGSEVFLLDEQGKEYTSVELASFVEEKMVAGTKEITLIIGGAYGVTQTVKSKANGVIALSKLTFSHQMIRVILFEQLYRAMTIIRGEPYHHM
ncbi:MAG: 23S rRNA (pseudouridine(1915)-N(3))-methyltransferase RlmH [Bacteroidales bacterium]|nr:23S rRNA (pseudouridine(1915)-N(3))-methyltransferase RlmH [Bacteroidales bacterium]MDD3891949.1 23S rRNA (pseudouridine(1915)-N(3))-methyltransferase RlmH [Bacteroidales bacterium]